MGVHIQCRCQMQVPSPAPAKPSRRGSQSRRTHAWQANRYQCRCRCDAGRASRYRSTDLRRRCHAGAARSSAVPHGANRSSPDRHRILGRTDGPPERSGENPEGIRYANSVASLVGFIGRIIHERQMSPHTARNFQHMRPPFPRQHQKGRPPKFDALPNAVDCRAQAHDEEMRPENF